MADEFAGRQFPPSIMLLSVGRSCRQAINHRDPSETMLVRGVEIEHATLFRGVKRYAPEISRRFRSADVDMTNGCRS